MFMLVILKDKISIALVGISAVSPERAKSYKRLPSCFIAE